MSNQNPFLMGKQAAFNELVEGAKNGCSFEDCLDWATKTANADMDKEASEQSTDYRVGAEAVCYGLQKQASAMVGNYEIDSPQEALAVSLEKLGSNEPIPENGVEAYRMGKQAAFQGLVNDFEAGTGIGDVLGTVHQVVNSGLDKEASQQDIDTRMGIDNVLHSFLEKTAHLYGQYRAESQEDHRQIFKTALEKVAEEDERANKKKGGEGMSTAQKAGVGAAGAAGLAGLADLGLGAAQGAQDGDGIMGSLAGMGSGAVERAKKRGRQLKSAPQALQAAKNRNQMVSHLSDQNSNVKSGIVERLKRMGGGVKDVMKGASLNEEQMAKEAGLLQDGQQEQDGPTQEDVDDAFQTMKEAGAFSDEGLQELEAQGLLDD